MCYHTKSQNKDKQMPINQDNKHITDIYDSAMENTDKIADTMIEVIAGNDSTRVEFSKLVQDIERSSKNVKKLQLALSNFITSKITDELWKDSEQEFEDYGPDL